MTNKIRIITAIITKNKNPKQQHPVQKSASDSVISLKIFTISSPAPLYIITQINKNC